MADLQVHYADGRTTSVPLDRGHVVVGRDANCDLPIEDPLASRRHARFYRDAEDRWWVEDLHSKNGTTLNDHAVQAALLHEGDRVAIGSTFILVHVGATVTVVMDEKRSDFGITSICTSTQRFKLPQQRLEKLYDLNERLAGRFERDDLLREVIGICIETLGLERVGLALWTGDPAPPQWVVIKNLRPDAAGEFRISRSLVDRALHNGERILIRDPQTDMADPTVSMVSNHICSAMCAPLMYNNQIKGVLYGDRVTTTGGYVDEDLDFFAALGRLAAMGLANVQLLEEIQRNRRNEYDLQLARQIQNRLFPSEPLIQGGLTIAAINEPGRQVSGDYFDYLPRSDGRITVVIADVSGKGIPAALLMANLQAAVHVTLSDERLDLQTATQRLNRLICQNVDSERFITAIIGVLDPIERTLTYVNVGHPRPIHVRPDRAPLILPDASAVPLGVEPDAVHEPVTFRFGDGPSSLFLYTDGVPDASNDKDEHFGEERLGELLRTAKTDDPRELIQRVRRSIQQFVRHTPQFDDITMLAIRMA